MDDDLTQKMKILNDEMKENILVLNTQIAGLKFPEVGMAEKHPYLSKFHNTTNNTRFNYLNSIRMISRKRIFHLFNGNACCSICENADYRVLVIHHLDHNHSNNLCSNLSILCANCHLTHHHATPFKVMSIPMQLNYIFLKQEAKL